MSWRNVLKLCPKLGDLSNWPPVDLGELSQAERKIYQQRRRAVKLVLDSGVTLRQASSTVGLSPSTISRILKRALCTLPGRHEPGLTMALLPHRQIARALPAPPDPDSVYSGYRGQFQRLLADNPEIITHVDAAISGSKRHAPAQRHLTIASLHGEILELLRRKGYGVNDYPFCTSERAREPVRQLYHQRVSALADGQFEKNARRRRDAGTVPPAFYLPGILEFDHHKLDVEAADVMPDQTRRIMRAVRIPRFWLGLAVERSSTAIVGYSFDYNTQPCQESVLHCLDMVFRGSDAMDGGVLAVDEPMVPALPVDFDHHLRLLPREIRLDNAWAHFATTVAELVLEKYGATMVHGLPAMPLARQLVESIFRALERYLHELPSTVGTGINDPRREPSKARKRIPRVTNLILLQIIHKIIARHNILPKDHLNSLSPLEYLSRSIDEGAIPVLGDPAWFDYTSPFEKSQICTVKLYKGVTPHVNLLYNRYTGPGLQPSLSGEKIFVRYNMLDIRFAEAFTKDGASIGRLNAPPRLLLEPIDERTLKRTRKFVKKAHREYGDPLTEYTKDLESRLDKPGAIREYMRVRHMKAMAVHGNEEDVSENRSKKEQAPLSAAIDLMEWRPGE